LSDVGIPVIRFSKIDEFPKLFSELLDDSMDNVWAKKGLQIEMSVSQPLGNNSEQANLQKANPSPPLTASLLHC